MNRKLMCVSNLKYKPPTAHGSQQAGNLLKYVTYRESHDQRAIRVEGQDRWMNRGMGGSVRDIMERCLAYQSEHVLLFSLVINPQPDLIAMVPPEERESFVRELTERVVERFFEARGIDTGVEWSAVLHHRQTDSLESPGQHNPHTHVILPGTYYHADEGQRKPLYFSTRGGLNHIELLHSVTQQQMVDLLERHVGRDWEQRYDALDAYRQQQAERAVSGTAHGVWEGNPVWAGVRRTDDAHSAAGVYGHFDRKQPDQVQFRALQTALSHEAAADIARQLEQELKAGQRHRQTPDVQSPSFDIDF